MKNLKYFRKYIFIPTYILLIIIQKFLPLEHPLNSPISLQDWSENATELTLQFSIFFWFSLIPIFIFIYSIIYKF